MRNLLATVSSSAVLFALAGPALAQTEPPPADGASVAEIIVVGRPAIVGDLAQIKQASDGVVDTATGAEIELLQDFTLAEAATRIPGVYGVAVNGQPRFLALRGFDARYNSTDLDGNPIWNSSENNRGTQLDLLPSSAVNQIDIYKALTPDIDANSIGGHVSVRTLRAFDGGSRPYFSARAEYGAFEEDNSRDDAPTYRVDGVGKFTFGPDDQFGAVLGASSQRQVFSQESYRLPDGLQIFRNAAGVDVEIPARGNWRFDQSDIVEKHDSLFAKLEARSADRLYGFVTANYYSAADTTITDRRRAFVDTRPDRVVSAEQGSGVAARGTDAYQAIDSSRDIDTWLLAGGLDYQIDALSAVRMRASWSRVRLEEDFFNSGRFENVANNKVPRTFDITGDFGTVERADTSGTSPGLYVYGNSTYEEFTRLDDDLYSVRLDYDHNSYVDSKGLGLRTGLSVRRLDRLHDRVVGETTLTGAYSLATNLPDLAAVDYFGTPIQLDRQRMHAALLTNGVTVRSDAANLGADYKLREDVVAAYGMVVYATDTLRFVGGLRLERTDLKDDLFVVTDGVATPDSFSNSYVSVLPSAHLTWSPLPDLRLRVSWGKTIGRPDFEAFAFGSQVTTDSLSTSTVTGNRDIGPRNTSNFDLGADYYFADGKSYVALGLFRKQLRNEHFAETTILPNLADPAGLATISTTTYSSNGKARVNGVEVSLVLPRFGFLPRPFDGLGLIANYSYLDGRYDVVLNDGTPRSIDSLRNQPRQLVNVTALYEYGPFSAALAYNWADEAFTGEFQSVPSDSTHPSLNDVFIGPYGTLDAKLKFDISPNVQLTLAGKNLTDEVYTNKTGLDRDLASRAARVGQSWFIGVKVKM